MISAISLLFFERVEGTMWIIRNRRSTNDRQSNGQKKRTNNDLQNPTQKTKDWATGTQYTRGLIRRSRSIHTNELVFSASRNTQL